METKENKTVKIILAALTGVLVLIIAVTAFLLVRGKMKENNYLAAMEEGQKYLAESNYEQAIIQYQKAIVIDPKQEEAYLSLAEIYLQQDDSSKAGSILRKGYKLTGSVKIQRMLNDLEFRTLTARNGDKEKSEEQIDLATASQSIAWNTSFVQKIVDYTFEDYKREYGQVISIETNSDGYLEVRHEKLDAVFYYRNTSDNEEIVDISRKVPYAAGMPEKIVLDSLGILFRNFEGGASLSRMQMLFGERVQPKTQEGKPYIENTETDLIAKIGTDSEGNIISPSTWNELILPLANKKKTAAGTLSGVVVDAVTGKGVAGAVLTFMPKSSSNMTVVRETDPKGAFRTELEADDYKINVEAENYVSETFEFTVRQGESYSGEQFVISPELSEEARIILEWGAQPVDLDSYLAGSAGGLNNIWVCFSDKRASSGGNIIAELDLDDINGYGPETTTIYDLDGEYQFLVFDYHVTGTMAQYGATVKVYMPGEDPVVIELSPDSGVENLWEVCRIDHGKLEIVNAPNTDYGTKEGNKVGYADWDFNHYWNCSGLCRDLCAVFKPEDRKAKIL